MTASAQTNPVPTPSRREMLNYAFGASIALVLAGSCGGLVWFMQQRIQYGAKSGIFLIDLSYLPKSGDSPVYIKDAYTWLVNLDGSLAAFAGRCPYRFGCYVKWSESNQRFECPCCGSKFHFDGTYIEGPAKHGINHFKLTVTRKYDAVTTLGDGSAISVEGAQSITVNTNDDQLIIGQPRPQS